MSHEHFDERRVLLLKSQNVQLQRQVLLLSRAVDARSRGLVHAESGIQRVVASLQQLSVAKGWKMTSVTMAAAQSHCGTN
eukprot:m.208278 g.208278  ORF g.208278 m.208278 type:complete len:80 (-) comp18529_c0_seq2:15-254(-)